VTLFLVFWDLGNVKSAKNSMSIRVSISSSASGFTSSNSSPAASSFASSSCDSSKRTSRARDAFLGCCQSPELGIWWYKESNRVRFLLTPQKNLSSHDCSLSSSYKYGRIRVRTLMQLRASLSGASSGSGNDGWCRRMNSRLVIANINVSRFSSAVSLVLLMSAGEKRLKMSSEDSGSSQNCTVSS
jgi:hypothetical protein